MSENAISYAPAPVSTERGWRERWFPNNEWVLAAVILFGFWPSGLLDAAGASARTLTQTALPLAGP